jgi:plasmid stabilization system protein ParE
MTDHMPSGGARSDHQKGPSQVDETTKSRDAAKRAVKAIRQGVNALGKHPEMGRPADELPLEFREWVIEFGSGAHVAIYRYDGTQLVILAIRHGREEGY